MHSRTLLLALVLAVPSAATADIRKGSEGTILFWTNRNGGPTIWAMSGDGSNQRLVFRAPGNGKRPALSPDGKWIVFDGASPSKPLSDFDIQIVGFDGTHRRTIAGTTATEIAAKWIPRSHRLSFSRWPKDGDWHQSFIWTVGTDGRRPRRLTRGDSAAWAPDGRRLVVGAATGANNSDLFLVDAATGSRTQITHTADFEEPIAWAPSGRLILFSRTRPGQPGGQLGLMTPGGTKVHILTTATGDDAPAGAFSPTGREVAYTTSTGGHEQIFRLNLQDSARQNLSNSASDDVVTSWR